MVPSAKRHGPSPPPPGHYLSIGAYKRETLSSDFQGMFRAAVPLLLLAGAASVRQGKRSSSFLGLDKDVHEVEEAKVVGYLRASGRVTRHGSKLHVQNIPRSRRTAAGGGGVRCSGKLPASFFFFFV